jgi:hypothetical protein
VRSAWCVVRIACCVFVVRHNAGLFQSCRIKSVCFADHMENRQRVFVDTHRMGNYDVANVRARKVSANKQCLKSVSGN